MIYRGIINRYRKFLPVTERTPIITLYEGNTPLLRAKNIEKFLDINCEIYLKFEGANPTGSFKDRGMTMAISKAVEDGSKAVICASTGNTAASAAAYSARAGIMCMCFLHSRKCCRALAGASGARQTRESWCFWTSVCSFTISSVAP